MNPVLEAIWNGNRLRLQDLSDPFRMTALLETELASFACCLPRQEDLQDEFLRQATIEVRVRILAAYGRSS